MNIFNFAPFCCCVGYWNYSKGTDGRWLYMRMPWTDLCQRKRHANHIFCENTIRRPLINVLPTDFPHGNSHWNQNLINIDWINKISSNEFSVCPKCTYYVLVVEANISIHFAFNEIPLIYTILEPYFTLFRWTNQMALKEIGNESTLNVREILWIGCVGHLHISEKYACKM